MKDLERPPHAGGKASPISTERSEERRVAVALESLSAVVSAYMRNFLSENTRKAYATDFKEFGGYLEAQGRAVSHPSEVTKDDVIGFRDHLRDRFSPTTVNRKLSALSSLFAELQNARHVDKNPCVGVKRPPARTKKERLGFSDREVLEILESFDEESVKGLNDKAVLSFLFYTGCRISECITTKVTDLSDVDGIHVVHLRGKGDKLRTLPLHPKLFLVLRKLIERRGKRRSDFLFTSIRDESNRPLTRDAVFKLLKSTMARLGMGTSRSLHSSRRTVISNLLQAGARLESVANLAGHSSVNTTLRYQVRTEKLEDNPLLTLKYRDTK